MTLRRYTIEKKSLTHIFKSLRVVANHRISNHLLGSGAHSQVFLATNVDNDKQVACKIIQKHRPGMKEAIQSEVIALRRLKHKHIIQFHGQYGLCESTSDYMFLFVEYACGENMHTILSTKGAFAQEEACRFFVQLVSALQHCHTKGVAHLDVKCENLVVDSHGNLKLIDFGLSILVDDDENCLCECYRGSPLYMAVEIFSHTPFDPFMADTWATGIVLYRMVTNSFPWKSKTYDDLVDEVSENQAEYPPFLLPELVQLLCQLLEPKPKKRITLNNAEKHPWVSSIKCEMI